MPVKITSEEWGIVDGKAVQLFTMVNRQGMEVRITNYGGTITYLAVPDKNGRSENVALAFESLEGYLQQNNPSFGCLVGRYANRIGNASFTLNAKKYTLAANNNGNSLHGGLKGFDKVVWDVTAKETGNGGGLQLSYLSKDGEEGFPGNLAVKVTYLLTEENALHIIYNAETDADTPVNFTNHTYFNLSAGKERTILEHELQLNANHYTVVDDTLIPTGSIMPVKGTALDFTNPKTIKADLGKVAPGYDHNFVLGNPEGKLQHIGDLYHRLSGRKMEVHTTQPGVQLYTANFLDGTLQHTYQGQVYDKQAGLCLETQHYPDAPNRPEFPDTILKPGDKFYQETVYKFIIQ